ncbi:MAG TPA: hypothetical protein VMD75_05950, partial [Candidatus Binataceae bacterium]|nr:hypothetical protein [Candidatus Binataceae bacterium]
ASARAQDDPANAAHAKTLVIKVVGTGGAPTVGTGPGGACTVGYSAQCASGSCVCLTIPTAVATGDFFSKQKGNVAAVSLTLDSGDELADTGCIPFFGEMALTASNAATATLDLAGTSCPATGTKPDTLIGGWGLVEPSSPTATGVGKIASGTLDLTTGVLNVKVRGPITE